MDIKSLVLGLLGGSVAALGATILGIGAKNKSTTGKFTLTVDKQMSAKANVCDQLLLDNHAAVTGALTNKCEAAFNNIQDLETNMGYDNNSHQLVENGNENGNENVGGLFGAINSDNDIDLSTKNKLCGSVIDRLLANTSQKLNALKSGSEQDAQALKDNINNIRKYIDAENKLSGFEKFVSITNLQ